MPPSPNKSRVHFGGAKDFLNVWELTGHKLRPAFQTLGKLSFLFLLCLFFGFAAGEDHKPEQERNTSNKN